MSPPPTDGLTYGRSSTNQKYWGTPCTIGPSWCSTVTNDKLKAVLTRVRLGPRTGFKYCANVLHPFGMRLRAAFQKVKQEKPDLYAVLGTAGTLCCRKVAGSSSFSGHSWGSAIDVKIDGELDPVRDGKMQRGLLELHPYMGAQGLYHGAGFSTNEDSMHFELAQQTLDSLASSGGMRVQWPTPPSEPTLSSGCQWPVLGQHQRGDPKKALSFFLQRALTHHCQNPNGIDGYFGKGGVAALQKFQSERGLTRFTTSVDSATWMALWEDVRFGDDSNLVAAIKELLSRTYGYNITVGYIFDDTMAYYVKQFQTSKGLWPDGIVGPKTWKALITGCSA